MRGDRQCGACAYSGLEKTLKNPEKKGDNIYHYQLFCRHSPTILKVENDGWCYQWELKHD